MDRSLAQLHDECTTRHITIPTSGKSRGGKVGKQDLIDLLAQQSYSNMAKPSWGLTQRLKFQTPMLCFAFKHLKPAEQTDAMTSNNWIAEEKYDGCRLWMIYHPDEGFTFFSRNISVTDYLPVDYTDQILLIKDGVVSKAKDFAGKWKHSFLLDAEVVCDNKNIDTSLFAGQGVVTGTELNATTALLALNQADSHTVQQTQAPLRLVVFDLLQFDDKEFWKQPLRNRKEALAKVMNVLTPLLPVTEAPYVTGDVKEAFYQAKLAEGKEGILLKNLNSPYIPTSSRLRTGFVKRKRSVAETVGGDIDAFITGFVASTPDKGWAHLIGAIEVSVFLSADGEEKEHFIASISSMPLALREKMTTKDAAGNPTLNPEYLGKVVTINGQDVSSKNFRFMHATADWGVGFRTDKTKLDCVIAKEILDKQVL